MSSNVIFDHRNYKTYVACWIETQPRGGHGTQRRIADAVKCQTPYVSRVLNGEAHFSLEQADALNHFMGHATHECHYFLLMVQYARAGTKRLQSYFFRQMEEVLASHLNLAHRIPSKFSLATEDLQRYFESSQNAVVHMLVTISEFQSIDALCRKTLWPRRRVMEILTFLIDVGLLTCRNGRYQTGLATMHLPSDSPMIRQHHINWRMIAMQNVMGDQTKDDLHYSSFVTVSRADFTNIKTRMVKEIEKISRTVSESSAEIPICINFDAFEALKSDDT